MRQPLVIATALTALALAGLGCPPSDYSTRCRFEGDTTTTCGTCVARACQSVVDECCGSYGCKDRLDALDRCSAGKGCDALFANTIYLKDLTECLKTSCTSECSTSNVTCTGGSLSCLCQASNAATTDSTVTICSAASVETSASSSGYCCAGDGWPAPGTSCRCFASKTFSSCAYNETSTQACRR